MNYLKQSLLLLAVLSLFSCVSSPGSVPEEPMEDSEPREVWKTIEVQEFLITMEEVTFPEGKADSRKEYKYSDDGLLLEMSVYSGEGQIIIRTEKTYQNRLLVGDKLFDSRGLISYTEYGYVDGQLSEESYYDSLDNFQSGSRFSYDSEGKRDMWISLDQNESPIMKTRYIYEGNLLVRLDYLTPYDESEGYTEFTYQDELLVSEASYNREGELEKKTEWTYEDGLAAKETTYFGSRINRVYSNTYDDRGLLVERVASNRSGRPIQRETYQYGEFVHEEQVLVKE